MKTIAILLTAALLAASLSGCIIIDRSDSQPTQTH